MWHPAVVLHYQLFRRRLVAAYGGFAEFCERLRQERLRPYRGDDGEWTVIEPWPRAKTPPDSDPDTAESGDAPPENYVTAVQLPRKLDGRRAEPVALVVNYNPHPQTERGRRGLRFIRSLASKIAVAAQIETAPDVHYNTLNRHFVATLNTAELEPA